MHQYILTALLTISVSNASENDIKKIYSDYKNIKENFFTSDTNKKNIKIKLEKYSEILNTTLKKIQTIESKSKIPTLTSEGNQLALDIELLEPIRNLTNSNYDKKACEEATSLNKINTGNEKTEFDMIESVINKLCK